MIPITKIEDFFLTTPSASSLGSSRWALIKTTFRTHFEAQAEASGRGAELPRRRGHTRGLELGQLQQEPSKGESPLRVLARPSEAGLVLWLCVTLRTAQGGLWFKHPLVTTASNTRERSLWFSQPPQLLLMS